MCTLIGTSVNPFANPQVKIQEKVARSYYLHLHCNGSLSVWRNISAKIRVYTYLYLGGTLFVNWYRKYISRGTLFVNWYVSRGTLFVNWYVSRGILFVNWYKN